MPKHALLPHTKKRPPHVLSTKRWVPSRQRKREITRDEPLQHVFVVVVYGEMADAAGLDPMALDGGDAGLLLDAANLVAHIHAQLGGEGWIATRRRAAHRVNQADLLRSFKHAVHSWHDSLTCLGARPTPPKLFRTPRPRMPTPICWPCISRGRFANRLNLAFKRHLCATTVATHGR